MISEVRVWAVSFKEALSTFIPTVLCRKWNGETVCGDHGAVISLCHHHGISVLQMFCRACSGHIFTIGWKLSHKPNVSSRLDL